MRYVVESYQPGVELGFRFTAPSGFDGGHRFVVTPEGVGARFEHHLEMNPRGWARVLWPLVFGPLHDALAEDAVARVVRELGGFPKARKWSLWVRFLRRCGRRA